MLDLLQSILAFMLTLLGLATLVTIVLETAGRFTRRRSRVMRHVIEILFEKEIRPLVEAQLQDADARLRHAIDVIVTSPIQPGRRDGVFGWFARLLARLNADKASEMSARDLLVRLSRTEVGTRLYEEARTDWEAVVERIESRYEELCVAARDWFTSSSAVASLIVGIVLAFAINFDGLVVLDYYLRNPDKAAAAVAQAETQLRTYEAAQKQLSETVAALRTAADSGEPADRAAIEQDLEALTATVKRIDETAAGLVAAGLPIGWSQYPGCRGEAAALDARCRGAEAAVWQAPLTLLRWAVVVLVSGVLIGLGGPFWYDAASGLVRVTQAMRGRGPEPGPAAGAPGSPAIDRASLKRLYEQRKDETE